MASLAKMWKSIPEGCNLLKNSEAMKREKNIRERLWEETSGHCIYCGRPVTLQEMEVDHIVPKSLGGGGEFMNKVCVCPQCNATKADALLEDFLEDTKNTKKLRKYHNRLKALQAQGKMSEMKAELLFPLIEPSCTPQEGNPDVLDLALMLERLTEWQARRAVADILIERGAAIKDNYGRKKERYY